MFQAERTTGIPKQQSIPREQEETLWYYRIMIEGMRNKAGDISRGQMMNCVRSLTKE